MKKRILIKISGLLVVVVFASSSLTALSPGAKKWLSNPAEKPSEAQEDGKLNPAAGKGEKPLAHGCVTIESAYITVIFTEEATKKIGDTIKDFDKTGLESLDNFHKEATREGDCIIKLKGWKVLENGRGAMYLKFVSADGYITMREISLVAEKYCSVDGVEDAIPALTGTVLCPPYQTRKPIRKAEE